MKVQTTLLSCALLFASYALLADSAEVPSQLQVIGDDIKAAAQKSASKLKEGFQGSSGRKAAQAKRIEEEKQAEKDREAQAKAQAEQN